MPERGKTIAEMRAENPNFDRDLESTFAMIDAKELVGKNPFSVIEDLRKVKNDILEAPDEPTSDPGSSHDPNTGKEALGAEFGAIADSLSSNAPEMPTLLTLKALCDRALDLEKIIEELESLLKPQKEAREILLNNKIPEQMAACGMLDFKLDNGFKVTLKEFVSGKVPVEEEPRRRFFKFIIDNEGEDIITASLSLSLSKGVRSDEGVKEAIAKAQEALAEEDLELNEKLDIHTQTLYKFIRDLMKDGKEVPLEELGLFAGKRAVLTPPKPEKEPKAKKGKKE